jgi:hypothetical protein
MAYPSLLVLRSEGVIDITYSIRSNHGSGHQGNLTIPNNIADGLE